MIPSLQKTMYIQFSFQIVYMNKKQLLKTFSNVGMIQILPVLLTITSLIGIVIIITTLTFNPIYGNRNPNETHIPSNSDLLGVTIFCAISLLFLSGLVTFLMSSFHFIRARQTDDYTKLVKGMKRLNWAWLVLSLFIILMFSLFTFKIVTDIGYQYY